MATSVTRHGITWFFNADYEVGQYCNGDWWVRVPSGNLSIIDITPRSIVDGTGRTLHGTMVNPGPWGNQGYDSAMQFNFYWAADNRGRPGGSTISAGNPLVVPPGSSVCSCRSHDTAGMRPQLLDFAVLTVVSAVPATGSFRPPYCGTDKSQTWKESDLNYGILPSLAPPGSAPMLAQMEFLFARTHNLHGGNLVLGQPTASGARFCSASNNQSAYGGSRAMNLNLAGLSLCLNYSNTQKRQLFVYLVQHGIDVYGNIAAGGSWADDGGLNQGLKPAIVFAARALNSTAIRNLCAGSLQKFHEDRQTWVVGSGDVGRSVQSPRETYTTDMIGTPEWGEKHSLSPTRDDSRWGAAYRAQNYEGIVGGALFIRLTGGRTWWDWQVYFDYAKRIWSRTYLDDKVANRTTFSDSGNLQIQEFTWDMWNTYDDLGDYDGGTIPPPSNQVSQPAITPFERVYLGSAQVALSVAYPFSGVAIRYTLDGSDPTSSSALYTGPISISDGDVQVRARGFAAGYDDSDIASALFLYRHCTSTSAWLSVATGELTGTEIPYGFYATPSSGNIDGVVAVGGVQASAYNQLAAICQFATDGFIKARNGGAYQSVNPFPYSAGVRLLVSGTVNTVAKTYTMSVTPPGGSPVVIADNYAFRTEQAGIGSIQYFTTVVSGANNLILEEIFVGVFTPPTPQVDIPQITPGSDSFYGSTQVSISCPLADEIRYTTNGTTPTGSSTLYTGPFVVSADAEIRAIGIKADYLDSLVASASIQINKFTADTVDWSQMLVGERFSQFQLVCDVVPSHANLDLVVGMGPQRVTVYASNAWSVRFSSAGVIQAINGNTYQADAVVNYLAGTSYRLTVTVNPASKTYTVQVTPDGGSPVTIATAYAFRSEHAAAEFVAYLAGITTLAGSSGSVVLVSINQLDPPPVRLPVRRKLLARVRR